MKIIIANWKSNKNLSEAASWIENALPALETSSNTIILAPAFNLLDSVSQKISDTKVYLGSQDLSPFPAGAYTGAVGTKNLEDTNVKYTILGHSERRKYFHETNNDVANKAREALLAKITPIVCVTKDTVFEQANALEKEARSNAIVAFEPIEHIGTGTTDNLEDILETKKMVMEAFGNVPYIYGGSVDTHTDAKILKSPEIDGFLVGGASLDAAQFVSLVGMID